MSSDQDTCSKGDTLNKNGDNFSAANCEDLQKNMAKEIARHEDKLLFDELTKAVKTRPQFDVSHPDVYTCVCCKGLFTLRRMTEASFIMRMRRMGARFILFAQVVLTL